MNDELNLLWVYSFIFGITIHLFICKEKQFYRISELSGEQIDIASIIFCSILMRKTCIFKAISNANQTTDSLIPDAT